MFRAARSMCSPIYPALRHDKRGILRTTSGKSTLRLCRVLLSVNVEHALPAYHTHIRFAILKKRSNAWRNSSMTCKRVEAHAKVNLTLHIAARRPDGYHDIETVMKTIPLHDTVTVFARDSGISIDCTGNMRRYTGGISPIKRQSCFSMKPV